MNGGGGWWGFDVHVLLCGFWVAGSTYVVKRTERHFARVALEVLVDDMRNHQTRSLALRGAVRLHRRRNVDVTDADAACGNRSDRALLDRNRESTQKCIPLTLFVVGQSQLIVAVRFVAGGPNGWRSWWIQPNGFFQIAGHFFRHFRRLLVNLCSRIGCTALRSNFSLCQKRPGSLGAGQRTVKNSKPESRIRRTASVFVFSFCCCNFGLAVFGFSCCKWSP